jgi:hypothetical protein
MKEWNDNQGRQCHTLGFLWAADSTLEAPRKFKSAALGQINVEQGPLHFLPAKAPSSRSMCQKLLFETAIRTAAPRMLAE